MQGGADCKSLGVQKSLSISLNSGRSSSVCRSGGASTISLLSGSLAFMISLHGPHGTGVEFSMRPSHRFPRESMNTTQADRPGPKYPLPSGLGLQVESTKVSLNGGVISRCPRKTIDTSKFAGKDSPGPAAYNRGALGLTTMARQRKNSPLQTGMGVAERFFLMKISNRDAQILTISENTNQF